MAKTDLTPFKFVVWETPSFDDIKTSFVYKLREKLDNKIKLTREEKIFITDKAGKNAYCKVGIPISGWMIPFDDVLKRFWVKDHGSVAEYYATDKTALRYCFDLSKDAEIVEIK